MRRFIFIAGLALIAALANAQPTATRIENKAVAKIASCIRAIEGFTDAALRYARAHGRVFTVPKNVEKDLLPHAPGAYVFVCPGSSKPYSFNNKLAGKSIDSIKQKDRTIVAYEGAKGKLVFKHDGKALVGLVDGTTKMVTAKEAKALLWK